jgi:type 1 glutamine amidotransferase
MKKQPEKVLTLFIALRINYPDDLEMKLNYAELLLWNKNFGGTKVFYSTLGQKIQLILDSHKFSRD